MEFIKYIFSNSFNVPEIKPWTIWKCRFNGHKAGVIWFNVSGFEPDMTCKCCGDDLG